MLQRLKRWSRLKLDTESVGFMAKVLRRQKRFDGKGKGTMKEKGPSMAKNLRRQRIFDGKESSTAKGL
jgi:hypothetical protein